MHFCIIYYANMGMTTQQQEIQSGLARLRQAIESGLLSQSEIARATGVHQSQVSRILSGAARRASPNVLLLCKFADEVGRFATTNPASNLVLMDALRAVWDGTQENAEAIAGLLMTLRRFHCTGTASTHRIKEGSA